MAVMRDLVRARPLVTRSPGSRLERRWMQFFTALTGRHHWMVCQTGASPVRRFGRFSRSPSIGLWLKVVSALPKAPFIHTSWVPTSFRDAPGDDMSWTNPSIFCLSGSLFRSLSCSCHP